MIRRLTAIIFSLVFAFHVHAASLGVWPINPRIDAPASATMVWVTNNSNKEEVVLQARVFSWRQHDNKDVYDPQDDLVVSPPMVTVKPGTQQIFRVVNRQGVIADIRQELSYRLIIDEIPVVAKQKGAMLNFQMRYSLPLFVGVPVAYANTPPEKRGVLMAKELRYKLVENPEKTIEVINNGTLNARLSKVKIVTAKPLANTVPMSEGLLGYVLAGGSRHWLLNTAQWTALKQRGARVVFEQDHQELEIAPQ